MNRAYAVLTTVESKRIIAKAVAQMKVLKNAMKEGLVVVANGTTTAYVAEELLQNEHIEKISYATGVVTGEYLGTTPLAKRGLPVIFNKGRKEKLVVSDGKLVHKESGKVLGSPFMHYIEQFGPHDVFIKGANAIDPDGNVGVLMGSATGGSIGPCLGAIYAKGANFIVPIGLEKMIPSVKDACTYSGRDLWIYTMGKPVGLMPIMNATVITEIEALKILSGVKAVPIAAGGVDGAEGAIILSMEGEKEQIEEAAKIIHDIKGEPKITAAIEVVPEEARFFQS